MGDHDLCAYMYMKTVEHLQLYNINKILTFVAITIH